MMEILIRQAIAEHMIEERLRSYESNRYLREVAYDALSYGYTGYKDYTLVEIAAEYFEWHGGEDDENPLDLDWDAVLNMGMFDFYKTPPSIQDFTPRCAACGRPELDCSANPCAAVIADREE